MALSGYLVPLTSRIEKIPFDNIQTKQYGYETNEEEVTMEAAIF